MTVIDELAVNVVMNTAPFAAGASRGRRAVREFGQTVVSDLRHIQTFDGKLRNATKSTNKWGASLAAAKTPLLALGAAMAAVGALVVRESTRAIQRIDEVAKTASKIGITTDELSRFHFAARQTGVSINTFDMALQRMTRRLSEAAIGTGEARGAIAELGLNAEQLAARSPAFAIRQFADAMDKLSDQGKRVRVANKLFDSEGVALVNTLRGGSAELDRFAEASDRLGYTLKQLAADQIVEAKDAIEELHIAWEALWQRAAIAQAPALKYLAAGVTGIVSGKSEAQKLLKRMENAGIDRGQEERNRWMERGLQVMREFEPESEKVARRVEELNKLVRAGAIDQRTFNLGMAKLLPDKLTEDFDALYEQLARNEQFFGKSADEIAIFKLEMRGLGEERLKDLRILQAELKGMEDEQKAREELARQQEQFAQTQKQLAERVFEQTRTPMERHAQRLEELRGLYQNAAIDVETLSRAIKLADEDLARASQPKTDYFAELFKKRDELNREFGSRLASGFTAGSTELVNLVNQTHRAAGRNPVERLRDSAEKALAEHRKTNRHLAKIASREPLEEVSVK